MKLLRVTVLLAITLGCFASDASAATPRALVARFERVSDGDTIIATTRNQTKLRIRLLGVDAAEITHGKVLAKPVGSRPATISIA